MKQHTCQGYIPATVIGLTPTGKHSEEGGTFLAPVRSAHNGIPGYILLRTKETSLTSDTNMHDSDNLYGCDNAFRCTSKRWAKQTIWVIKETPLTVYVNGQELATLLCSPNKLISLVLGFLHLEGIIESVDDVALLRACREDAVADVRLNNSNPLPPLRRVLTSGCGGGASLSATPTHIRAVESALTLAGERIPGLQSLLMQNARLYPLSGGVHASMITEGSEVVALAEDVGRHNTIDKLDGDCLLQGISSKDLMLCTTGRLSSEMLFKAARMGIPIILSHSSPTHRAVELGNELGITVIGYVRRDSFAIYSHPERISGEPLPA